MFDSLATSLALLAGSQGLPDLSLLGNWLGYELLNKADGYVLRMEKGTSFPFVCVDEEGRVRAVRTLVVSSRRKVSLI